MKLTYLINNKALYNRALTHKSFAKENNERLEFLGDSLVNLFIAEAVYQLFPEASEGQLSRLRSSLVKKETLAELARNLNLGDALKLGSGELKSGGFRRDSILADALESLIAAIYIDSDFLTCKQEVLRWFEKKLSGLNLDIEQRDFKTRLQEYLQGKGQPIPEYRLQASTGKDHDKSFVVQCVVKTLNKTITGTAASKKAAEQQAAESALRLLKQV